MTDSLVVRTRSCSLRTWPRLKFLEPLLHCIARHSDASYAWEFDGWGPSTQTWCEPLTNSSNPFERVALSVESLACCREPSESCHTEQFGPLNLWQRARNKAFLSMRPAVLPDKTCAKSDRTLEGPGFTWVLQSSVTRAHCPIGARRDRSPSLANRVTRIIS